MNGARASRPTVTAVRYAPPSGYALDVEVYDASELRRRGRDIAGRFERIDFHVLLISTGDEYRHVVDFETVNCSAGSVVILRPGQVHRFGDIERFEGWLLIFRAELLPPVDRSARSSDLDVTRQLEALPTHVVVPLQVRRALEEALARMADDSRQIASPLLNTLLSSQLHALLARVSLANVGDEERRPPNAVQERFHRFRAAVEREHHRWHSVRTYAKHLGCSEKSLARAAVAVSNVSAKTFVVQRIVLEAKRRLVHSSDPVATIADELGFDEPTNFVKFFRREAGVTPLVFRSRHAGTS